MQINRCPKCGRKPSVILLSRYPKLLGYEVECYDCGLHTGRCKTHNEAVTKWNALIKNSSSRGE